MVKKIAFILIIVLSLIQGSWGFEPTNLNTQLSKIANAYLTGQGKKEHVTAIAMTTSSYKYPSQVSVFADDQNFKATHPLGETSLFQVGSILKSYIAVIILQLAADPKYQLQLDNDMTQYFPEYPRWRGITIKQLMNMTSGIPDYFLLADNVKRYAANAFTLIPEKTWIASVYTKKLLFTPGTKFNYSNTNYLLLGLLIEKLTQHPLVDEINQRIINPLHLTHTYYVTNTPPTNILSNLVPGHQNEKRIKNLIPIGSDVSGYSLSYLAGAGALISTSEDIATWVRTIFTKPILLPQQQYNEFLSMISERNAKPISEVSKHNPAGFGLGISAQYSTKLRTPYYIYQGMTLGYRAIYVYVPAYQALIAITVNSSSDAKKNSLIPLINEVGDVIL